MSDSFTPLTEAFRYCPYCGDMYPAEQQELKECGQCKRRHYLNHNPAVGAICLNHRQEILYVKRKKDPYSGTWDFPAGFVDLSDGNLENAFKREIKEEVGIDAVKLKFFGSYETPYLYGDILKHNITAFFVCYLDNQEIRINQAEISEYKFSKPTDMDSSEFGFPYLQILHEDILNRYQKIIS